MILWHYRSPGARVDARFVNGCLVGDDPLLAYVTDYGAIRVCRVTASLEILHEVADAAAFSMAAREDDGAGGLCVGHIDGSVSLRTLAGEAVEHSPPLHENIVMGVLPLPCSDEVITWSHDGYVVKYDFRRRTILWKVFCHVSSPDRVCATDTMAFVDTEREILSLNLYDGATQWSRSIEGSALGLVRDEGLYVARGASLLLVTQSTTRKLANVRREITRIVDAGPDTLAVSFVDGTIRLFNISLGKFTSRQRIHRECIDWMSCSRSSDGQFHLATMSRLGEVRIDPVDSDGIELADGSWRSDGSIRDVAANLNHIALRYGSGRVRILSVDSGQLLSDNLLKECEVDVLTVQDSLYVAAADRLLAVDHGGQPLLELPCVALPEIPPTQVDRFVSRGMAYTAWRLPSPGFKCEALPDSLTGKPFWDVNGKRILWKSDDQFIEMEAEKRGGKPGSPKRFAQDELDDGGKAIIWKRTPKDRIIVITDGRVQDQDPAGPFCFYECTRTRGRLAPFAKLFVDYRVSCDLDYCTLQSILVIAIDREIVVWKDVDPDRPPSEVLFGAVPGISCGCQHDTDENKGIEEDTPDTNGIHLATLKDSIRHVRILPGKRIVCVTQTAEVLKISMDQL